MADNSVDIVVSLDDKQAQQELNRLTRKIESLRAQLKSAEDAKLPLVEQAQQLGVQLDNAKAKLEEMQNASQGTYTADQIAMQKETVASLQAQWDAINKKIDAYDRQIAKANASLQENEARAGELSAQLVGVTEQTRDAGQAGVIAGDKGVAAANRTAVAVEGISSGLQRITHRIIGLAKRVFFFSLFTKAFRSMREYISNALKSSNEFVTAMGQLKGALATAFQPILTAIIPALTTLISVLAKVVSLIASVISLLFGTTIKSSKAAAKGLNEEADAIKGVGGAAEAAEKQLASFDEINQLNDNSGGGGGGGGDVDIPTLFDFPELEDSPVFRKIKELIESLDFSKLKESWERLKISAQGLIDVLERGLGWVWDNILVPLAHWTIEELAPRLVELLAAAFDLLRVALEKFGEIFKPVWEVLLKPFFEALGDIALGGIDALIGFLEDLTDAIDDFELSADGFGKFVEDVFGAAGEAIGNFGTDSAEAVGGFIDKLQQYTDIDLSGIKRKVLFEINYLSLKIEAFCLKAGWLFNDLIRLIGHLVTGDMEAAKDDFETIIHDAGVDLDEECVGMAKTITDNMMDGKTSTQDLGQAFKDLCIDARNELPQAEDAVDEFADGVTNDVNNTLTPLQKFWDKLVGILDTLLKLSSISFGSGFLSLLSGGGLNLGIGNLLGNKTPHLAEGSVIPPNREFLAVLGDQKSGTNIEAPLDTIVQAFRTALMERQDNQNMEVKVYLDSREIRAGQQRLSRVTGV